MKLMNKKGVAGIIIGIILIVVVIWLIGSLNNGVFVRECTKDAQCNKDSYCSSDFRCHQIPVIEKTNVTNINNYEGSAWILAFAIIVAAIIIRWDNIKKNIFKEPPHEGY